MCNQLRLFRPIQTTIHIFALLLCLLFQYGCFSPEATDAGPSLSGGTKQPDRGTTEFSSQEPPPSNTLPPDKLPPTVGGKQPAPSPAPKEPTPDASNNFHMVTEGTLHKRAGQHLFLLNTYKGLTVFDISNERSPKPVANLPIYGYPTEMFIDGHIAYVLVKEALYLLQTNKSFQFQRRLTSQLVTVDISTPSKPTILQRIDIAGHIQKDGTKRIGSRLLVLSTDEATPQATAYVFSLANANKPTLLHSRPLLSGIPQLESRSFQSIHVKLVGSKLLISEIWALQDATGCGNSPSETITNVADISDLSNPITIQTRIQTQGTLLSHAYHTYFPGKGKRGLYVAVLKQGQPLTGSTTCTPPPHTLLVASLAPGENPSTLSNTVVANASSTLQGCLFDTQSHTVHIATKETKGTLTTIHLKEPSAPQTHTTDLQTTQPIQLMHWLKEGSLFALATSSTTCTQANQTGLTALQLFHTPTSQPTKRIHEACLTINEDNSQAAPHPLQAGSLHWEVFPKQQTLTLIQKVWYTQQTKNGSWQQAHTRIWPIQWDLSQYNAAEPNDRASQFLNKRVPFVVPHPTHYHAYLQESSDNFPNRPLSIHVSDGSLSLAAQQPNQLISHIRFAPNAKQLFRFGNKLVQQIKEPTREKDVYSFRVLDSKDKTVIAQLQPIPFTHAVAWNQSLLLLDHTDTATQLRKIDFSDPTQPKTGPQTTLPTKLPMPSASTIDLVNPYNRHWLPTTQGFVVFSTNKTTQTIVLLHFLDDHSITHTTHEFSSGKTAILGLAPLDESTFYAILKEKNGLVERDGSTYQRVRYFAQQWRFARNKWNQGPSINTPGPLLQAFHLNGQTLLLTKETNAKANPQGYTQHDTLHTLTLEPTAESAQLTGSLSLAQWAPKQALLEGNRIYLTATRNKAYIAANPNDKSNAQTHLFTLFITENGIQRISLFNTLLQDLELRQVYKSRLLFSIAQKGLLLADFQQPKEPIGLHFYRTLDTPGYAQFYQQTAFFGAGHQDLTTVSLRESSSIPSTN